ncbi:MAG: hypothetical protein HPY81_05300 [Firmicutes bacterium]|nr:hypothetical protein [Bacillota bacterium]
MFQRRREVTLATAIILVLAVIGLNTAAGGIYSLTLNQGKVFSLDWSKANINIRALGADYALASQYSLSDWGRRLKASFWQEKEAVLCMLRQVYQKIWPFIDQLEERL